MTRNAPRFETPFATCSVGRGKSRHAIRTDRIGYGFPLCGQPRRLARPNRFAALHSEDDVTCARCLRSAKAIGVDLAPKAPEAPATDATVEEKVAYIVAALDGVATPETLDALGFSKTARSYGWYWNSDKNGKPNAGKAAATALGLRASLRKVEGVRCLVLSAA